MKSQKCPVCNKAAIKYGTRKTKLQQIQVYLCKSCSNRFSITTQQNKTYPISIILKAISTYNLCYTLKEVSHILESRHKIKLPLSTISSWIKEYKETCTFSRLRKQAIKNYSPKNIIHKKPLSHIQPYTFKYHKAKLNLLFRSKLYNNQFHNISNFYEPLKAYLEKITTEQFPHHIFTYNKESNQNNEQRASQIKFVHLKINEITKNNQANQLAKIALNLAKDNKNRHQAIQDFFLINDSTTIAVEIPVYLTNWDAGYYRNQKGFIFPLNSYKTPITGHIDILQIRNGLMYILDYKPEAEKEKPIEQLTIYALALSRKLNLPLYYFKCSWFDESNYFEFFPLHAVYDKKSK